MLPELSVAIPMRHESPHVSRLHPELTTALLGVMLPEIREMLAVPPDAGRN
jgi:hypothetical protein